MLEFGNSYAFFLRDRIEKEKIAYNLENGRVCRKERKR
jgi:hypothetical protein